MTAQTLSPFLEHATSIPTFAGWLVLLLPLVILGELTRRRRTTPPVESSRVTADLPLMKPGEAERRGPGSR